MAFVDPTRAQFKRMAVDFPQNEPVLMLNLIRYRAEALYPPGHPLHGKGLSGKEAYALYKEGLAAWARDGPNGSTERPSVVFSARPQLVVTGPADEVWDEMFVMAYPSAATFLAMVKDGRYAREIVVHRTAAVQDSRLVRMTKSSKL